MVRRTFLLATAAATASALCALSAAAQSPVYKSSVHDYRLVTVAEGLVQPWAMTFLPGGDLLVAGVDELDRAVGQLGQNGDIGVAAQAEDVLDPPALQVPDELT